MFSRLFRLHILYFGHVMRAVPTKAYLKIKVFVHGQALHHPLQKCNNFRNFLIFYMFFENFMILIGLDGADPGVRKKISFKYAEKKTLFQAWSEFKMCNPKSLG